jgi:UDP:flavonoid glycosyltransferase YjiC (YdhE family)
VRVLFASTSGFGHVCPMLPLARALVRSGHDVTWALAGPLRDRVAREGLEVATAGLTVETALAEYWRRYPEAKRLPLEELPDHMGPKLFGEIAAPAMLADLLPRTRDLRPDLVVNDASEFAAPIVAASIGVPSVTHGIGARPTAHRVEAVAAETGPMWRAHGLEPRPFGGSYDTLYLDIYPPSLRSPSPVPIPCQPLRSVPPVRESDVALVDIGLPGGAPLIYLTFGTLLRNAPLLQTVVDAIAALDVRLVVTVGPDVDPTVLRSPAPNVRVERFVPQAAVLAHASVVVSHGGAGTFLGALARGIPQLCLPRAADQFLNGEANAAAGTGITLQPREVTASAVAGGVRRLLDDASYRRRSAEVACEIAAMPGPDEVAIVLERIAVDATE